MARKVVKKGELFILIVIGLLLLTLFLKKSGVNVAGTSVDTEIIDRPHD